MNRLFQTQEIGSLSKPRWRIKGYKGKRLSEREISEAVYWGRRLGIDNFEELVELLEEEDSLNRRRALLEWSARYAIRLFEITGLDIVYAGEQWRSEMYDHVIRKIGGFKSLGHVKSFDSRYFNKAACIDKPEYSTPFYLEEFLFTRENTEKCTKVPFTGPYTLVDWSFNEFYEKKLGREIKSPKRRKFEAKREFVFDLIKGVLRPEIGKLVDSGATWIQIDEPAATTNPNDEEMELFVESFNKMVQGFNCDFSLHNCYSNYEVLAKYACELGNCSQLALEFANRDGRNAGVGDARTGYREIESFEEHGFLGNYGLGVVDVHTDFVEPPELVRDRILHVAKLIMDPYRINVSLDCGLRTRTWETSFRKLTSMVQGAEMARKAFE